MEFKDGLKHYKFAKRTPEQQKNWDEFWVNIKNNELDRGNDRKGSDTKGRQDRNGG